MKTFVAVPCMDFLDVDFVKSLVNLKQVGSINVSFNSGALIYDSREKLTTVAIEEKADYILWLDSDMVFSPSLLVDLMAAKKDFVSALYFKRRPPFNPVLYKTIRLGLGDEGAVTENCACPPGRRA